jgi:hypothetical protein
MKVYLTMTHSKHGAHCLGVFTDKRLAEETAREWLYATLTELGATEDQARWAANCEDYSDIGHLDDNYTEIIECQVNTDTL